MSTPVKDKPSSSKLDGGKMALRGRPASAGDAMMASNGSKSAHNNNSNNSNSNNNGNKVAANGIHSSSGSSSLLRSPGLSTKTVPTPDSPLSGQIRPSTVGSVPSAHKSQQSPVVSSASRKAGYNNSNSSKSNNNKSSDNNNNQQGGYSGAGKKHTRFSVDGDMNAPATVSSSREFRMPVVPVSEEAYERERFVRQYSDTDDLKPSHNNSNIIPSNHGNPLGKHALESALNEDTASEGGDSLASGSMSGSYAGSAASSNHSVANHGLRVSSAVDALVSSGISDLVSEENCISSLGHDELVKAAPLLAEIVVMLTSMDAPVIVMNPQCTILIVSPSVGRIFGYSSDELTGNNINVLMPDALAEIHDGIVRKYTETSHITKERSSVVNQTRPAQGKHKDGRAIPIEISVRAIRSGAEIPFLYVGLIRDTQLEVDMRTSLRESAQLESSFPFPYLCADEYGIIDKFNPAAEKVFGYSKSYAVGRSVNLLLPPKLRKRHADLVRSYVQRIRDAGVDAVKSDVVGKNTQHMALRLPSKEAVSNSQKRKAGRGNDLGLDMFKIELQLRVYLSREGDVRFYAFARDLESFASSEEQRDNIKHYENFMDQMFPPRVAQELREHGRVLRKTRDMSILFCDIVGFSRMSEMMENDTTFELLADVFGRFDAIAEAMPELTPIKTIGDSYMVAVGIFEDPAAVAIGHAIPHASAAVTAAARMLAAVEDYRLEADTDVQVRIGIHSGESVAGIVDTAKPAFDVIGKCVNMASRAESTGLPGHVQITVETFEKLHPEFQGRFRKRKEKVHFKNIGDVSTYVATAADLFDEDTD